VLARLRWGDAPAPVDQVAASLDGYDEVEVSDEDAWNLTDRE